MLYVCTCARSSRIIDLFACVISTKGIGTLECEFVRFLDLNSDNDRRRMTHWHLSRDLGSIFISGNLLKKKKEQELILNAIPMNSPNTRTTWTKIQYFNMRAQGRVKSRRVNLSLASCQRISLYNPVTCTSIFLQETLIVTILVLIPDRYLSSLSGTIPMQNNTPPPSPFTQYLSLFRGRERRTYSSQHSETEILFRDAKSRFRVPVQLQRHTRMHARTGRLSDAEPMDKR